MEPILTFGRMQTALGNTCSALKTDNRSFTSGRGLSPQQASPEACGNARSKRLLGRGSRVGGQRGLVLDFF